MTSARAVFAAALLAATIAPLREASACAAFFAPTSLATVGTGNPEDHVPFLSRERVLLIWDEATQTEHFIREVGFDRRIRASGASSRKAVRVDMAVQDRLAIELT